MLSVAFLVVYALGKRGSKSLKLQAELARKQYKKLMTMKLKRKKKQKKDILMLLVRLKKNMKATKKT